MLKSLKYYLAALGAIASVMVFTSYDDTPGKMATETRTFIIPQVDMDKDYSFAGERIPIENFDVKERLEQELIINSYRHSTTILNIKNSVRYFPVIEKILKESGIPEDFKYAAVAESDFRNGTSGAGARGVWQLMQSTAKDHGLEVGEEVDERLNLEKATLVACQHLKHYYERFGNWTLAAAAYNMGAHGLDKEVENQHFRNYYDLNLSDETNRYIFRIAAIKEVLENPEDYGFDIPQGQRYPPLDKYTIVTVDTSIANLGDFAKQSGVSYRMLKIYNPWLRNWKLTNTRGKKYDIKIPK